MIRPDPRTEDSDLDLVYGGRPTVLPPRPAGFGIMEGSRPGYRRRVYFEDDPPEDGAAESRSGPRESTWQAPSASRGIGSSGFGMSGLSSALEESTSSRPFGTQGFPRRRDDDPSEVFWCRVGDESCPRTFGKRPYEVEMHRDVHELDCEALMARERRAAPIPVEPEVVGMPLRRSNTLPLGRTRSLDEGVPVDSIEMERQQMAAERREIERERAQLARERLELEELRRGRR